MKPRDVRGMRGAPKFLCRRDLIAAARPPLISIMKLQGGNKNKPASPVDLLGAGLPFENEVFRDLPKIRGAQPYLTSTAAVGGSAAIKYAVQDLASK